jgi:hypothetical protein
MTKSRFTTDGYSGRMPAAFCPGCFKVLDGVTNLESSEAPKSGDFTICIYCAAVLRFTENMQLELSSLEDIPVAFRLGFAKVVMAAKERPDSSRREEGNKWTL